MSAQSSPFSDQEQRYMARALVLARRGLYTTEPNPRVGCVIAQGDRIIGEGWHRQAGGPHAEIVALDNCSEDPRGATVFVTLEPCSFKGRTGPCANALISAGVKQVIYAHNDPHPKVSGAGRKMLEQAGIEVRQGLMSARARELNRGFIKRMEQQQPYVQLKIAASLDGATALSNGQSQWITCEKARQDVHQLRAQCSAILTGVGTVLADDPQMTARLEHDENIKQPLPVVLDSCARCPKNAKIFSQPSCVFVAKGSDVANIPNVNFIAVDCDSANDQHSYHQLNLTAVLRHLAQQEINDVLVEAGPRVSGAFLRANLVDELIVYQAPVIMGNGSRGMLDLGPFESMDNIMRLNVRERETIGDCSKLVLEVRR